MNKTVELTREGPCPYLLLDACLTQRLLCCRLGSSFGHFYGPQVVKLSVNLVVFDERGVRGEVSVGFDRSTGLALLVSQLGLGCRRRARHDGTVSNARFGLCLRLGDLPLQKAKFHLESTILCPHLLVRFAECRTGGVKGDGNRGGY